MATIIAGYDMIAQAIYNLYKRGEISEEIYEKVEDKLRLLSKKEREISMVKKKAGLAERFKYQN